MEKIILLVEDFQDTRVLMKFLLENLGYKVIEAENGWKAVDIVKLQVPDLIIMDMALPLMDGLSATKLIRKIKGTTNTPIIAFTASGQFIYDQAISAGCNDLMEKPLDIDKLQLILDRYI